MAEQPLAPEIVERVRRQLLLEHPEMDGAEAVVKVRRHPAGGAAVAAKAGLAAEEPPTETQYTVSLRKEVEAEDGVKLYLVVRVTVDEQGQEIKRRTAR